MISLSKAMRNMTKKRPAMITADLAVDGAADSEGCWIDLVSFNSCEKRFELCLASVNLSSRTIGALLLENCSFMVSFVAVGVHERLGLQDEVVAR